MSWQATTGNPATGYKVRINPDCQKRKTKTVDADTRSVTVKVKWCQTYKVWVKAQNEAGASDRLETTWQRPQQQQEQGVFRGGSVGDIGQGVSINYGGSGSPLDNHCLHIINFVASRNDNTKIGSYVTTPCVPKGFDGYMWRQAQRHADSRHDAQLAFCPGGQPGTEQAVHNAAKQFADAGKGIGDLSSFVCPTP